ncbi:MAG TPA: ATP-binding protein [Candidatus Acidoferrales bacterium]|nr:ATP-binding protein [Candidatus Acidoferrales bacterium]
MEGLKEIADRLERSISQKENITQEPSQAHPVECGKCGDLSYVVRDGKASECECVLERRVVARLPQRYRRASLIDFPKTTQELALLWLECPGDGLFIVGPAGTGKTYFAAAIVRTLLLIRQEVFFRRCADLYAALRESYRVGTSEDSVMRDYVNSPHVVLDDLCSGGLSDHERRSTLEVFDQRINKSLPTIVTSNWELEQIEQRMDERIASRLSSFRLFPMDGPDRRIPVIA